MKTLIQTLREGKIPEDLKSIAKKEGINPEKLVKNIISGEAVILGYRTKRGPKVIGKDTRVKVNANIGTSTLRSNLEEEREKLHAALSAKTDAIMDLSLSNDLGEIRKMVLSESTVPVGTVPIYEAATLARIKRGAVVKLDKEEFFEVIERQLEEGVDFITVHVGVIKRFVDKYGKGKRIGGIVSRGGAITAAYIKNTGKENPLYEHYDRLLDIAEKYDAVLSLGDGMRPGAIHDAGDMFEVGEQEVLGELQQRALERGVMSMIEGPGHVPLHLIKPAVERIKRLTHNAPLYLLGPIVTDIAPGYDHITSAIGASVAAWSGADFICYVTPSEHLGLPTKEDVHEGVIAARIAAHVADIARGLKGAEEWDKELSIRRKSLDWDGQIELSIDPERAFKMRKERSGEGPCTMCGEYCVFLILGD